MNAARKGGHDAGRRHGHIVMIEFRSNKMGRATYCTASSLELIPDKDIAQSRSHRRRVAKNFDEGVLPADASAPAHEFIMNECPGIGTTAAGVDVFSTGGIIVAIRSADCGLFWRVRKCRKPACRSRICGAFCCSSLSPSIRFPPISSRNPRHRRRSTCRPTIGGFSRLSITSVGSASIFFAHFNFSI